MHSGHDDDCNSFLERLYAEFLDRERTPDVFTLLWRHLNDCPDCIPPYEFVVGLRESIARRCHDDPPPDLRDRILRQLPPRPDLGAPGGIRDL